jgi:peptide/nickel transport system permease protein
MIFPGRNSFGRRFRQNRAALWAGRCLIGIVIIVMCAPMLVSDQPDAINLDHIFGSPTLAHVFGTDELGRDVLSRLLYGGQISLFIGIMATTVALIIGTCVGMTAGYFEGIIDILFMRTVDMLMAIPAFFLLLLAVVIFGNQLSMVCLILGMTSWPPVARLVRASFISFRNREFVLALRAMGVSDYSIMVRHILPNVLDTIFIAAAVGAGQAILAESALSFLGLGIQPPTPTWGNMLQNAQLYIFEAPYLAVIPGSMIFITVYSLHLISEGLRDAMDVKLTQ